MKRIFIMALALSLVGGFTAFAASYESDFGFRIDLPSGWTVVSKKGVKEKPEIVQAVFETAEKDKVLIDMPAELYAKLKEKISGGDVEYFFRTDSPNFSLSVYGDTGSVPTSPDAAAEACRSLPGELAKVSKNPAVRVYECRLSSVGVVPALYIVADAYERGERYVQYMVQNGSDRVLLFSAVSSGRQDFGKIRAAFDSIMQSVQLK